MTTAVATVATRVKELKKLERAAARAERRKHEAELRAQAERELNKEPIAAVQAAGLPVTDLDQLPPEGQHLGNWFELERRTELVAVLPEEAR